MTVDSIAAVAGIVLRVVDSAGKAERSDKLYYGQKTKNISQCNALRYFPPY